MSIASHLNELSDAACREALTHCCGAANWVEAMLKERPFTNDQEVHQYADDFWAAATKADILEAFSHHPRIGGKLSESRGSPRGKAWSESEQSQMETAEEATKRRLEEGNHSYFDRFGYIYIICATGLEPTFMLQKLDERLRNDPETELRIAAAEQLKITHLRLEKLLA